MGTRPDRYTPLFARPASTSDTAFYPTYLVPAVHPEAWVVSAAATLERVTVDV